MKLEEVSYQGLTMAEITADYPYMTTIPVNSWMEFERRVDPMAQWVADRNLVHEQDFFTDVTSVVKKFGDDGFEMVEIWAFKNATLALLFKLTFG